MLSTLPVCVQVFAKPPLAARRVPNEIVIKLRAPAAGAEDTTPSARMARLERLRQRWPIRRVSALMRDSGRRPRARDRERPDLDLVYRVRLEDDTDVGIDQVLAAYRAEADVEYAERNPIVSICAEPDDPLYDSQWALEKIDAAGAWDTCRGSADVVVAVVDTGVDYRHRDLEANAWRNETELNGIAGADDDENGYVDDVWGYNFIYNSNESMDDHGHGTHCAGTIAAVGDNGLDITGVCWTAQVMPVKILGADGDGSAADAAVAIYYAVANGADVISCSWGGPEHSQLLAEAITYAHRRGVVIVAAAGNEDSDELFYPAAYPEVIAVAATTSRDARWSLSNHGPWVDVAAPGQGVLSLRPVEPPQNAYTVNRSGTSMATPHVSGAAALLLSADPFLTAGEIREILGSTGDPIAMGICASNARVNVARALEAAVPDLGIVRLDRDVYALGSDIGVLLADGHLKGTGSQTVFIITTGGDVETVTVTETASCQGVFRATLGSDSGVPVEEDGRVQVRHDEGILLRYQDTGDGRGDGVRWTTVQARMDAEPPAVVQVDVEMAGPVARVEVVTSEPTTARIRYGQSGTDAFMLVAEASELSDRHRIKLGRLVAGADYEFIIDLVDAAGNQATADNAGAGYSFEADITSDGFRVPEVYATIQAAIDDAWDGDTVWVADGTYSGRGNIEIDLLGKAITVRSENGPQGCIIDCQGQGGGFYVHSGEDERTVVDGFTISNGYSDFGAGMLCSASSPTIRNCIFVNNEATRYGGGLSNYHESHPLVVNCVFRDNACGSPSENGYGGGMSNRHGSSPTVQDCTFIDNTDLYAGGGMENDEESDPQVVDCVFENNSADSGGAVYSSASSRPTFRRCRFSGNRGDNGAALYNRGTSAVVIDHCIFNGNVAERFGGAVENFEAFVTMTHCTAAGNHAGWICGGIHIGRRSEARLDNCILWGNTDGNAGTGLDDEYVVEQAQITQDSTRSQIDYSCVEGWSGTLFGAGTFGRDPLFADAEGGDFHLRSEGLRWDEGARQWVSDAVTSPCIDAGHPGWPLGDEALTLPDDPNNAWTANTRVNMGAYGGTAEASLAPSGWMLLADLTNDGAVDWQDFSDMTVTWLGTDTRQPGDLNRDGTVDGADFAHLAPQWRRRAGQNGVQAVP